MSNYCSVRMAWQTGNSSKSVKCSPMRTSASSGLLPATHRRMRSEPSHYHTRSSMLWTDTRLHCSDSCNITSCRPLVVLVCTDEISTHSASILTIRRRSPNHLQTHPTRARFLLRPRLRHSCSSQISI
jgi:hypothetical protein